MIRNQLNCENQPALFSACFNGSNDIAKDLIKRGLFIGDETVIESISRELLEQILDDNIKTSGKAIINIKLWMLAQQKYDNETMTTNVIVKNSRLQKLVVHLVISSFVSMKWKKVSPFIY